MAGQGIERRRILRYIGIASVASTFPGFRQWTFACSHGDSPSASPAQAAAPYKPLFFTPEQFRLVEHLTDIIIPADDTPGAKAAGVAEFIDFMLANRVPVANHDDSRSVAETLTRGAAEQVAFVGGLGWLDARSKSKYKCNFLDATSAQQTALLGELAYKSRFTPNTERGREFFQLLRHYTVVGYYTSKIGLETLGYPGLRTAWPKFPGCSHPDDPEHARLTEPTPQSAITSTLFPSSSLTASGNRPAANPVTSLSSLTGYGPRITDHVVGPVDPAHSAGAAAQPPRRPAVFPSPASSLTDHGSRNTDHENARISTTPQARS